MARAYRDGYVTVKVHREAQGLVLRGPGRAAFLGDHNRREPVQDRLEDVVVMCIVMKSMVRPAMFPLVMVRLLLPSSRQVSFSPVRHLGC
jgi:hypothetical protein